MSTVETIYFIHHSHTDVGFTHDQPIVWELYTRFMDEALLLAERYAEHDTDGAFRWTVETTAPLVRWLAQATAEERDRFVAMERAGRIEVTGMLVNLTPLYDTDQVVESLQNVGRLRREYGFDIRHAMNCDVNGQNWPVADALLDAGIDGFSMAINNHFGGPVRPRPLPFRWQTPSGRELLTYNGWTYDKGWTFGVGHEDTSRLKEWWPLAQEYLDAIEYPLPILMLQSYDPFGDNGSAFDFTPFVDAWNAEGNTPRIVMCTPRTWWAAVREYRDELPLLRGDWTDYWNFGAISSARETALNRASRARLRSADALHAALGALRADTPADAYSRPEWAAESYTRYRERAWEALNLWDEHTWGADASVRLPEGEDTQAQWHHKAHYAYEARSLSLLLHRDGTAELARHVEPGADGDLLVFNPLPWARTIAGPLYPSEASARGRDEDGTAARHHLSRRHVQRRRVETLEELLRPEERFVLPPTGVPGFGYAVVKRADLRVDGDEGRAPFIRAGEAATVENHRYRLTVDRERGGVVSLRDKVLGCEWVDDAAEYPLHGFVHEEVADHDAEWPRHHLFNRSWDAKQAELGSGWKPDWRARRRSAGEVLTHRVLTTPLGAVVLQTLRAPGIASVLTQRVFLPDYADWVEFESWWDMGLTAHPEATYLAFPFALDGATPRYDVGDQPVVPDAEQLPGSCRDYFTVQGWVDFSREDRGITVVVPDNPMVQLGGFQFGAFQDRRGEERPLLLGWVTNNYWETNFRAHQPGRVAARYRLHPHRGGLDETSAHRWAAEAVCDEPLVQPLCEPGVSGARLPDHGALLGLPDGPVRAVHVLPAGDSTVLVRLVNASDEERSAELRSGTLRIGAAQACDLFGEPTGPLPVAGDRVAVTVPARRYAVVRLRVGAAAASDE